MHAQRDFFRPFSKLRADQGAYASLDNLKEAEATFRKAIALRPKYWLGYNSLGKFYYEHCRYNQAVTMFTQVVTFAPGSFRGWSNLGGTYVQEGRYEEGIRCIQRSISLRPTAVAYSNLAAAFFELHRFDDAARACNNVLNGDERNYVVWGNLAAAYYYGAARGKAQAPLERAISLAKENLTVNPSDATVIGDLATYYSMVGRTRLATDTIDDALRLAPASPDVLFDAALVYSDTSDVTRTLHFIREALQQGLSIALVRSAPAFDHLRSDPKFNSLIVEFSSRDPRKDS